MRRQNWMFFKGGFFLLALVLFPLVIMLLWNALLPDIFGLTEINFWQALGLLVLAKILFGFRFGWGRERHGYWRSKWKMRLENMSPEERAAYRQKYAHWCNRKDESPETRTTSKSQGTQEPEGSN